jgi:hypothetical protein
VISLIFTIFATFERRRYKPDQNETATMAIISCFYSLWMFNGIQEPPI